MLAGKIDNMHWQCRSPSATLHCSNIYLDWSWDRLWYINGASFVDIWSLSRIAKNLTWRNLKDVLDFWIFTLVFAHSLRIGKYGRIFHSERAFLFLCTFLYTKYSQIKVKCWIKITLVEASCFCFRNSDRIYDWNSWESLWEETYWIMFYVFGLVNSY